MNRYWYLVLLLLVCLTKSTYSKSKTRQHTSRNNRGTLVIGGKFVSENDDAAWHVAIIHKRILICAGTLLRNNIVLTAAECVKDLEPDNMSVRAGSTKFKVGGQLRKVRETIYHPDYIAAAPHANNVALIKLNRPFNSTLHNIQNVELPADEDTVLPSSISVYGWGYSKAKVNTTMTKKLRVSKTKVYSSKKCAQFLSDEELVESAFCTGDSTKRVDICTDDLGSPAMYKRNIQYGIVAESSACSEDSYTTILTNVLAFKPWIMETFKELRSTKSKPSESGDKY